MIELLGSYLVVFDSGFDVLRYLTVRTIGGTITALFLSIFLGPIIIKYLNHLQFSQSIRDDGPQSHLSKAGTPTMGGLIILFGIIIFSFMLGRSNEPKCFILCLYCYFIWFTRCFR